MSTFVNKPDVDLSKIKALNDINYHRWSAKMLIHFDSMEMDYVLIEDHVLYQAPAQTTLTQMLNQNPWYNSGCYATLDPKASAPKASTSSLYISLLKQTKTIWDMLQKKYGADDAGIKKYAVSH